MATTADLRRGDFLSWETETPSCDSSYRTSPCFTFQGSEWCFKFFLDEESHYVVFLIKRGEWNGFRPFHIYCYAESGGRGTEVSGIGFTLSSVHPDYDVPPFIWRASPPSIAGRIMDSSAHGKISFIFIFQCVEESCRLKFVEETGDKSTQENLDSDLDDLSADFNNLLDAGELPDVQLQCCGRIVPAHRSVLATRSEVFAAMFRNEMAEHNSGVVDILDVEAPVFNLFLKFLYSGKIPDVSSDVFPKLYIVGDKYVVHSLKRICIELMIRNLSGENYQTFLKLADTHNEEDFKSAVISFIADRPEFLRRDTWYTFTDEHPKLGIEAYRKFF